MKFSEMIAARIDLAVDLEVGLDSYSEAIAGGYGDYLASVVCDGDPAFDARYQMVLLRRSVERHRDRLESLDAGLLGQIHEDERIRALVIESRDEVDGTLRLMRSTCRGLYGPKSLGRFGMAGLFPRGAARLHRLGVTVKASLERPDPGLAPLLDLDFGPDAPGALAQLARKLDAPLDRLGAVVRGRHQARRRTVAARLERQAVIREFDDGIRGIVRLAQGMSRLAGRAELGKRLRPILQRTLRRLEDQETDDGEPTQAAESGGAQPESAQLESGTAPEAEAAQSAEASGEKVTEATNS